MNIAEEVIDWLYREQLQVDDEWAVRTPTGFTWWADQNAQSIEIIGQETAPDGEVAYLIGVRTEMVTGLELTDAALHTINEGPMRCAALAGPVYDAETTTLSLCSLARVYDGMDDWTRIAISSAAVLQLAECRLLGPNLATELGAQPAVSAHPDSGVRGEPDEMVNAAAVFVGEGKGPCNWPAQEFVDAVAHYMQQPPSLGASTGGLGLTVEFPYGDKSSLCQVIGERPHPLYGNGLMTLQMFPFDAGSEADGVKLALELNAEDLTSELTGYGFGSYVYTNAMICFAGFIPNALYRPGLLPNVYYSCASRAHAMAVRLLGREWDGESFSPDHSAIGRAARGEAPG